MTARLLLPALLLLQGLALPAAAKLISPDQLEVLVAQGRFEEAWADGSDPESLEAFEGNPKFDFNLGLAGIETGHFGEAIFALERVMFVQPDNLRVRLELARAHYFAGNYPAAEREFQRVLDTDPPDNVRDNIQMFLSRIEAQMKAQQRQFDLVVDLRGGYDSNINSAVDATTIGTPIGIVTLDPSSREADDEFARVRVGARLVEPLDQRSAVDASLMLEQKANIDSNEFDLGLYTLEGGWSRRFGANRLRLGTRLQQVTLDYSRFQNNYGLMATWDMPLGQTTLASLSGGWTTILYDDDHDRDTDQFLLSGTLVKVVGQFTHALSLYGVDEPAQDSTNGDFNGRDYYGVLYSLRWEREGLVPFLRAIYQESEHDADQPVFGDKREDDYLSLGAGVRWTLKEALVLTAEVNYTEVDSNLEVFEFDRTLVEIGLQQTF